MAATMHSIPTSTVPDNSPITIGAASVLILRFFIGSTRHRLPPGPPSHFVVGNLFQLPLTLPWVKFGLWSDKYGALFHLKALRQSIVVVSDLNLIRELFEKRGSQYSDRPTFVMAGELVGFDRGIVMCHHNDTWRRQRRLAKQGLSSEAVKAFLPAQQTIILKLMSELLESPKDFLIHLRQTSARLVMAVTYGIDMDDCKLNFVEDVEDALHLINRLITPGAYLVDLINSLRYLPASTPFVSFKQEAVEGKKLLDRAVKRPFQFVCGQKAIGLARPSFTLNHLESFEHASGDPATLMKEDLMWCAGHLFGAGVESTYSAFATFILAMVLHPAVQHKAQEELFKVIGANRLPSLDDRKSLPYVNAVIKESLRWRPPIPLGIPRRNEREDTLEGYYIPAGATVIPNIWMAAKQDGGDEFDPERFTGTSQGVQDPWSYVFGFGRRACPGKHLMENVLFLFASHLLVSFITSPKCERARPDPAYSSGIASYPESFECQIEARSGETKAMVVAAYAATCR